MSDLISREKLLDELVDYRNVLCTLGGKDDVDNMIDIVQGFETVDAVSPSVVEQYKWERDVAIVQLEELGIGFGQKKPDMVEVVRCKDCKHRGLAGECQMCYTEDAYDEDYGYDYWDVDKTVDEGFCHCGEKRDVEAER